MESPQAIFKDRRFRLAIGLLIAILLFMIIRANLINGHITVTTDDPKAEISLIKINKNGERKSIKTTTGKLAASVPGGEYSISAQNSSNTIEQHISLKARELVERRLSVKGNSLALESFLPAGASDIADSSTKLLYIDGNQQLTRLDASGIPVTVDLTHSYAKVKWADIGFGVGETIDNHLLIIRDEVVTDLVLPASYTSSSNVSYTIDDKRLVYVSVDKTIYAGQDGLGFQKLLDAKTNSPSLIAGNGRLAIMTQKTVDENSQKPGGYNEGKKEITIFAAGKTVQKGIEASDLEWSPNGKFFAATEEFETSVYDSSLRKVASIPQPSPTNSVWSDNNTLLYGSGANLWRYRIGTQQSEIVTSTLDKGSVSAVYTSADRSYIYVVSAKENDASNYTTGRVYLTGSGRSAPSYSSTLGIFFPSHTDQCTFSYTNFIKPTVLITSSSNPDTCLDAAKEELKADQLPVGDFGIQFYASLPD